MIAEEISAQVYDLIYRGQVVELDCSGIYHQVELIGRDKGATDSRGEENADVPEAETPKLEKAYLPAFMYGTILTVSDREFSVGFKRMPEDLLSIISPRILIPLFIIDPMGVFKIESPLTAKAENPTSLTMTRPRTGLKVEGRRFIRVSVRGTALILDKEIGEDELPNEIVELGGGGIRVQTNYGWLRSGDETMLSVIAGFVDKHSHKHISLELTIPARVVWARPQQVGTEGVAKTFHVGFAFTEISIADQERLISFLLSALKSV